MSTSFDPYYTWLGIPPEEQPPDHYRLLGIRRFEPNVEVNRNTAEQRLTYIRSFLSGDKAVHSQQVLDEIDAARDVLLQPEAKGTYDRELRQHDAPKLSKAKPSSGPARPAAFHKPAGRASGT